MAKRKSSRLRKFIVLIIIVGVLGGLGTAVLLREREVSLPVQTVKVARRDVTETVVATGRIQPVTRVVINPEVSGEIVEMPVQEGQEVRKGDLLVRIKPDNYIASRNSAEASYKSALSGQALARANLEKARHEFNRMSELYDTKLVSESQFVDAKTSLDVATASHESSGHQTEQAQAALARSEDELSKTSIHAPMDGTVTQLKSEVGERVVGTAMMAGTEIMTLAKLDAMEAWVDIGEVDIVLIQPGQKARLEVDAYRDRDFSGQVTEIANAAKTSGAGSQQEAVRFEVKIRVHETERFRPGMSVTADIETRHRTNVLTVPIQSVTSRVPPPDWNSSPDPSASTASTNAEPGSARNPSDGEASSDSATGLGSDATLRKPVEVVFTVQDGVARMRAVERGISDDTHTEITSGLEEGMEVVSGGYRAISRDLEDGARVRLGGPVVETSDD